MAAASFDKFLFNLGEIVEVIHSERCLPQSLAFQPLSIIIMNVCSGSSDITHLTRAQCECPT
jgi:hypothetical protein